MSIGVIAEVTLKPEGTAKMIEVMKERLSAITRSWDGCEYVYLYADVDDPNHLFLVERWESKAHYDNYREWAMAQGGTEEILKHTVKDMTWQYLNDTGA